MLTPGPVAQPVIVRCYQCGGEQVQPRDPFCKFCDEDLRPFIIVRRALAREGA